MCAGSDEKILISSDVSEYITQNGVRITKLKTDFKVWPQVLEIPGSRRPHQRIKKSPVGGSGTPKPATPPIGASLHNAGSADLSTRINTPK